MGTCAQVKMCLVLQMEQSDDILYDTSTLCKYYWYKEWWFICSKLSYTVCDVPDVLIESAIVCISLLIFLVLKCAVTAVVCIRFMFCLMCGSVTLFILWCMWRCLCSSWMQFCFFCLVVVCFARVDWVSRMLWLLCDFSQICDVWCFKRARACVCVVVVCLLRYNDVEC